MPNKISTYVSEDITRSSVSSVRDKFRDAIGSYWDVGQPDLSKVLLTTGQTSSPTIIPQDELTFRDYKINYERKVEISFHDEQDYFDEDESQTLPARQITMSFDAKPGAFVNYEEFLGYITGIIGI
jgi:hypothetical protein